MVLYLNITTIIINGLKLKAKLLDSPPVSDYFHSTVTHFNRTKGHIAICLFLQSNSQFIE